MRDLAQALLRAESAERQDPLATWTTVAPDGRHHVPQERLIEAVAAGIEGCVLGANRAGKTEPGAALVVAFSRGLPSLAGIRLPRFRMPASGIVLTRGWKQQIESTQATILELIGDWPHEVRRSHQVPLGAQLILVRPDRWTNDDPESWSRIWFHVAGVGSGESSEGANIDWAWADEPPAIEDWREIRMRSRDDVPCRRWITMTPKWRDEWLPILQDFTGCEHRPQGGRLLIRATLEDNPFLSDAHKQERREAARGDVHERSRLYGEPVDVSGACPFRQEFLDRWSMRCRDPQLATETVFSELQAREGVRRNAVMATWEIYTPFIRGHSYYLNLDPAMGLEGRSDPCGIHIYDRSDPDGAMVARFKAVLEPYATGWLAALMARHYTDGPNGDQPCAAIERNHRSFPIALRGMREAGHTNFYFTQHEDRRTGQIENQIGWTTDQNRGLFVGAIQTAMLQGRYPCPSLGVVDTLRAFRYLETRESRAEGPKDEDVILLGQWIYVQPMLGEPTVWQPTPRELVIEQLTGRRIEDIRHSEAVEDPYWYGREPV